MSYDRRGRIEKLSGKRSARFMKGRQRRLFTRRDIAKMKKEKPLCKCRNGLRVQWKGLCSRCYAKKSKKVNPEVNRCMCGNRSFKRTKGGPVCRRCYQIEEKL
jgi:hypothetical protein